MLLLYAQMKVCNLFLLSYNQDVSLPEVKFVFSTDNDRLAYCFLSSAGNLIIIKSIHLLLKSDQRQFSQLLPVQALVILHCFPI